MLRKIDNFTEGKVNRVVTTWPEDVVDFDQVVILPQ